MTTLRGIAQPSDCLLTHMLLAYWRKLLESKHKKSSNDLRPHYCRGILSAATPSLGAAERIICLWVVDGKLDSPNVDPRYRDILRSGSLPF